MVWLVHNDVSKNKQSAGIYYVEDEGSDKLPVIEIDWAKNKKSSFKGRTYNFFVPNFSRATECSEEDTKRFDSIVYSI